MNNQLRTALTLSLFAVFTLFVAEQAAAKVRIDVTYTNGEILDGPLSFGLAELPASVTTRIILRGRVTKPSFGPEDVISVSMHFGDAHFTEAELFPLSIVPETIDGEKITSFTTLSYRVGGANPVLAGYGSLLEFNELALDDPCASSTDTVACRISSNSNFELNIFGQDIASGDFLHYHYTTSEQFGVLIPEPAAATLFLLGLGVFCTWSRLSETRM